MYKMTSKEETDNNITVVIEDNDIYISRSSLQITLVVISLMLILLFVLGSTGNIVSLIILFHQRMRNQVNIMLGALCISDTVFLLHGFLFTGLNIYKKFNPVDAEEWRVFLYPYLGAYGSVVSARITSCLTTLLCIERFVAVFYPMQARIICSKRNTVIAIITITLLTIGLFIPFMYKYERVVVVIDENTTYSELNKTEFYLSHLRFYNVYGNILNVLFRFAPLVIIPLLNVCMIRAVRQAWRLRRDISGHRGISTTRLPSQRPFSSTSQHRITIMLIIVAFIFFICILPGAVNSIITHASPSYSRLGKYKNLYFFISSLTFLLETLNSSINFIIYMAMCRKFRLIYKEKCCCGNGKYYNKISVSSVKDRFKWVSSRKSTDSDQNSKDSFRKAVSDSGPNRHKPVSSRRALYDCVHSDEYPAVDKRKHTNQSMWILDSKCCIDSRGLQNSDEEKINVTSDSVINGGAYYGETSTDQQNNDFCVNRKTRRNKSKHKPNDCSKRKFHFTKDSLRSPRQRSDHISNPYYFKMTINNIYNIDQELPYISDCTYPPRELRGVDRSKV